MHIVMFERDIEEMKGIEWFLKNYLSYDFEIEAVNNVTDLENRFAHRIPDLLLIEMELVDTYMEALLKNCTIPIIALTAEPIFQQAQKAISIQAIHLFVKPIPLEELKSAILALPTKHQPPVKPLTGNAQIYSDLYFHNDKIYNLDKRAFFLLECAQFDDNLKLYNWLNQLPIFEKLTSLPLQKRIICLVHTKNPLLLKNQLRLIMQEWTKLNGDELNVALYDGKETTMLDMYNTCKNILSLRFYNGYSHIFKTSQKVEFTRLDPFLSFEDQQLWITSLDKGDIQQIKTALYRLTTSTIYYHHEDVRIHLTSILAQIRRYMKKYLLQEQNKLETQYRALFHYILEHPVLYAIIRELILFTQTITGYVKERQLQELADYSEIAVSIVERDYRNPELSLQSVAKELNISSNYLSNIFSKRRGIPFKRYIQHYRLQQAADLIISTTDSIASIAESVGFIDSNYFSKVFRAYFKTTPYRYRLQKNAIH